MLPEMVNRQAVDAMGREDDPCQLCTVTGQNLRTIKASRRGNRATSHAEARWRYLSFDITNTGVLQQKRHVPQHAAVALPFPPLGASLTRALNTGSISVCLPFTTPNQQSQAWPLQRAQQ